MIVTRLSYRINNDMKCFNVIIYKRNFTLIHNNNSPGLKPISDDSYEGQTDNIASITVSPIM